MTCHKGVKLSTLPPTNVRYDDITLVDDTEWYLISFIQIMNTKIHYIEKV